MAKHSDRLTIMIEKGKRRMTTRAPLSGIDRLVFVLNRQFTNAPNTTQISSGAGCSSAAGNNAAIRSPNTQQQQSVGAGGTAKNKALKNRSLQPKAFPNRYRYGGKEVVIVINDQIVKLPKRDRNASATQVASGGGRYSTSGTNSAIESPGTKQQHAVGGRGLATNEWRSKMKKAKRRR